MICNIKDDRYDYGFAAGGGGVTLHCGLLFRGIKSEKAKERALNKGNKEESKGKRTNGIEERYNNRRKISRKECTGTYATRRE